MPDTLHRFQLGTNFLSRTALRLESMLDIIEQACQESNPIVHRYALNTLIEILDLIDKPELKSRFLKELIRIEHVLDRTNAPMYQALSKQIHEQIQDLNHFSGTLAGHLIQDVLLQQIRHIHQPNNKECEFHSPALIAWLSQPTDKRQEALSHWLEALSVLRQSICIYLSILRASVIETEIETDNGFFRYALAEKPSCQLVILKIPPSFQMIPQLHLGHHGLTIRLYDLKSSRKMQSHAIKMNLAVCHL